MFTEIEFRESAFKHGVTEEDIRLALDTFIADGMLEDEPNKYLLIGFDTKENLLEVIYSYDDEYSTIVFHAMACRKEYLNQIER